MPPPRDTHRPLLARGFATTHWTLVRAAAASGTASYQAREQLCREYWYPLYAYLRRTGRQNDAEDIAQDFFAHILRRSWLLQAEQSRGKFRSFLLTSLDNFVRDLADQRTARKRRGAYRHVPLDMSRAGGRYEQSKAASVAPATIYEMEWAATIVGTALRRLEQEYLSAEKRSYFERLRIYLQRNGDAGSYAADAAFLATTVANVKVCVFRLRKRYSELIREEVARTVASPDDVDDEMRHLCQTLSVQ